MMPTHTHAQTRQSAKPVPASRHTWTDIEAFYDADGVLWMTCEHRHPRAVWVVGKGFARKVP